MDERERRIRFTEAGEAEAEIITRLRKTMWEHTYRGIYPDAAIDQYDSAFHLERDLGRARDPSYRIFLVRDGEEPVGYFSLQHKVRVHLQSLYLLPDYQRLGIGKAAMELVRDYCREQKLSSFTCNCNAHNQNARAFYAHLGGLVIREDLGHSNLQEDQITYQFSV